MTERFGAALAAVPGSVAVGAPGYNAGAGAIYFIESALGRNAEPQACTRGAPCPINCGVGKCVGDVLCVEPECTSTNCGCELGFSCD